MEGQPGGGGLGGAPLHERVAVAVGGRCLALVQRPAVVAALVDAVELVPGAVAELAGPQLAGVVEGEPLHVAVAHRPHRRPRQRVAGRGVAVGGDPEDLAGERVAVLGELLLAGLARGHEQVAVLGEEQPAAVVDEAVGDAGEHRVGGAEAAVGVLHPHHAVVLRGADVGVDQRVRVVRRGRGQAEQAGLALRGRDADLADGPGRPPPAGIASTRVVSRSPTRAVPSGRNVIPHGAARPRATVPTTRGRPGPSGLDASGLGSWSGDVGCPVCVVGCGPVSWVPRPSGSPSGCAQAVSTSSSDDRGTARAALTPTTVSSLR